jgi:hypothetical protein
MNIDFINDLVNQGNNIKKQSVKNNNNKTSSASIFLSGDAYTRHVNSDGFTPLFVSKNLNQCNFQKTVKNRHDILEDSKNNIITKILLPYSLLGTPSQQNMFMYIGEKNFFEKIERAFNSSMSVDHKNKDSQILSLLDSMPTFDAFLLKDKFETEKIHLDDRYVEITEEDYKIIKSKIMSDFEEIVKKTLGQDSFSMKDAETRSYTVSFAADKLFKALWNLDDMEVLVPLANAMGIKEDESKDYFYAWKGLIFYVMGHSSSFENIETDLNAAGKLALSDGRGDRDSVKQHIKILLKDKETLNRFLNTYKTAFHQTFVADGDSTMFLHILKNASSLFWTIGTIIGKLDVFISYFSSHQNKSSPPISAEDIREYLRLSASEP